MAVGRLWTTLVIGSLALVLCVTPATAQKTWVGDTEEWNDFDHWDDAGVPGPGDDVVHAWTLGVPGILMDVPPPGGSARYEVGEFRLDPDWVDATAQGVLTLKGYDCFEQQPICGDKSRLQFVGGMDASGTVQEPLAPNLYRLRLGPEDVVLVGEPTQDKQPGGAIENATHFEWELKGSAGIDPPTALVSGNIGPGKWTVDIGIIHVGWATDFDAGLVLIAASPGTIDSGVKAPIFDFLDPNYNGASMWRIDGMELRSKQIRNLDYWRVRRDNGQQNGIGATEYMEIRAMTFEGQPFDGPAPTNL